MATVLKDKTRVGMSCRSGRTCLRVVRGACGILIALLLGLVLPVESALAQHAQMASEPENRAIGQADIEAYSVRPRRMFIRRGTSREGFRSYFENVLAHLQQTMAAKRWPASAAEDRSSVAILTVSIEANGDVERVELTRSSGSEHVDQRLVSVALAATPFPRPPHADEYDFLHLVLEISPWMLEQDAAQ